MSDPKKKTTPTTAADVLVHPLFADCDPVPPWPFAVRVYRMGLGGKVFLQTFGPTEIGSPDDVRTLFGGGAYQVEATDERSRMTARVPMSIDGPPKIALTPTAPAALAPVAPSDSGSTLAVVAALGPLVLQWMRDQGEARERREREEREHRTAAAEAAERREREEREWRAQQAAAEAAARATREQREAEFRQAQLAQQAEQQRLILETATRGAGGLGGGNLETYRAVRKLIKEDDDGGLAQIGQVAGAALATFAEMKAKGGGNVPPFNSMGGQA